MAALRGRTRLCSILLVGLWVIACERTLEETSHRDQCSHQPRQPLIATWQVTETSDSVWWANGTMRFESDGRYFRDPEAGALPFFECGGWGCWQVTRVNGDEGEMALLEQRMHFTVCGDVTITARFSLQGDTLKVVEDEGWWGPQIEWSAILADSLEQP